MSKLQQFDPTIIKLAKSYKIPPLEWEDIAQELRIHLWEQRNKYDPQKAKYGDWAYISCMNKIKDLAKYWTRQKRDQKKIVSLEEIQGKYPDLF